MEDKFYLLGSFEYVADVQIIKGKLESEGIPVFLRDENTLNSDPLISNAIGGVKLQVYAKDKEKAIAVYNEVRAYAIDTNGDPVKCPNCKAEKSEAYYERKTISNFFITGISTEVGKTIASAIITEALEADYWKPVQAGDLENSDSHKIGALISNTKTVIHKPSYELQTPMSPHAAAEIDDVQEVY